MVKENNTNESGLPQTELDTHLSALMEKIKSLEEKFDPKSTEHYILLKLSGTDTMMDLHIRTQKLIDVIERTINFKDKEDYHANIKKIFESEDEEYILFKKDFDRLIEILPRPAAFLSQHSTKDGMIKDALIMDITNKNKLIGENVKQIIKTIKKIDDPFYIDPDEEATNNLPDKKIPDQSGESADIITQIDEESIKTHILSEDYDGLIETLPADIKSDARTIHAVNKRIGVADSDQDKKNSLIESMENLLTPVVKGILDLLGIAKDRDSYKKWKEKKGEKLSIETVASKHRDKYHFPLTVILSYAQSFIILMQQAKNVLDRHPESKYLLGEFKGLKEKTNNQIDIVLKLNEDQNYVVSYNIRTRFQNLCNDWRRFANKIHLSARIGEDVGFKSQLDYVNDTLVKTKELMERLSPIPLK